MTHEVKNKVMLVTGGASGIGAEVAKIFANEGAKHIAILDLSEDIGTQLQNEVNSKYGANKTKFYRADVTDDSQLFSAFECVVKEHGSIDVVVNSAGIMNDSWSAYKKEIEVNVTALITSTLKAIELMRKDQGGRGGAILNIASVLGLTQVPYMPIYAATKSAVIQFSNCIGHEYHYSKTGVRVLAICFGRTATPLVAKLCSFDRHDDSDLLEKFSAIDSQSPQSAARGLIEAYKRGGSGSTWVIAESKPAMDVTESVTNAYKIMSERFFPQAAARGLIEAYTKGGSGSTWVIEANKPAVDAAQSVTQAFEIMSEKRV